VSAAAAGRLLRLTLLAAVAASIGCGSSYMPDVSRHHDARPLASLYDILVEVPGIALPQFPATGLTVDMTLEIQPGGLSPSGAFDGSVTVNRVAAGGTDRPFSATVPLAVSGLASGADWSLDSVGPILVGDASTGTTTIILSLTGILASDGRTIDGTALVTSSGETGSFHAVKQRRYLVAGTDFGVTGTVSLIKVRFGSTFEIQRDLEVVSGDPVARAEGGGVFVVNRYFFDNVQVLDPAAGFSTSLQFSTGNGSNPHDALAIDPNRLYVTRYEAPYNDVLIADPTDGHAVGYIDLSALAANASGTPRADGMIAADGLVFVGLQDIDSSFTDYGPGILAVVDPATDSLVRSIPMSGVNPFGRPALHPVTGDLYYAMAGVFQGSLPRELSGGIEVVDPRTLTSQGLLIDDDDLGGNVSSVALWDAGGAVLGYGVVTDAAGVNAIRRFDADSGAVDPGAVYTSASLLPEVVSDGDGYLLVPERDLSDPRLVVLQASTAQVVAVLRLSLPPFSVAVLTRGFVRN